MLILKEVNTARLFLGKTLGSGMTLYGLLKIMDVGRRMRHRPRYAIFSLFVVS